MGKDVDFGKITLNFSSVFKQLNDVAKEFAKKDGIVVDYGTFDARGDSVGVAVYLMMDDDKKQLEEKSKFLDVAKTYIKYSVGEDEVASVSEDKLLAITKQEHDEGAKDHTTNESQNYLTRGEKSIINTLFEEDSDQTKNPSTTDTKDSSSEKSGEDTEKSPEDTGSDPEKNSDDEKTSSKDNDEKTNNQIRGYAFTYWLTVSGKSNFLQKVKSKSKGLFSDMISDLQSFQLNWKDGTSTNLGQILNPEKWKQALGIQDIDKDKLVKEVVDQFQHDFSGSEVSYRDVSVDQRKDILTKLNRLKRLTPQISGTIKSKIPEDVFSVVVQVGNNDIKFSDYNERSIAKTMTKAFGTSEKLVDFNDVSEKDVIKISNIQQGEEGSKLDGQKNAVDEADDNDKQDDSKKELDSKRQELDKIIRDTLQEQAKKELKGFFREKSKVGFVKTDKFIDDPKLGGLLNDSSINIQLKDRSSHVLYVLFTHRFSMKKVNETLVDEMFSHIFEDGPGGGKSIKTQVEDTKKQFVQKATAVLVNTVTTAITSSGQSPKNKNLDVIAVVKTLEGKIQESCADGIVCMLFEDETINQPKPVRKKASSTPVTSAATVAFFAMLPDPTQAGAKQNGKERSRSSLGDKVDWYIIPNKHIKNIDKRDDKQES